ncbi:hypothetical protein ABPG74_005285 [Tetrahymena malaccensis]
MQTDQLFENITDLGFHTYFSYVNERMKIILKKISEDDLQIPQFIEFRHLFPEIQFLSIEVQRDVIQHLNNLTQFFASLPQISHLKELQIIIHSSNNIQAEGCQVLQNFITNNSKSLNSLDIKIHYNQIKEQGAIYVGKCLQQLTQLENLILEIGNDNDIRVPGCEAIGIALTQLKNLKNLSICIAGKNNIQGKGAANLLQGLKILNLDYLKLSLFPNEIDEQGFLDMQNELTQIKSLSTLDLSLIFGNTQIYVNGFKQLGMNFPKLENLKVLDFQFYGPISTEQSNYLVQQIHKLEYLEFFKMNFLPQASLSSEVQIDVFLQSLSKCKTLNKLHISLPSCVFSVSDQFQEEIQIPFQNLLDFEFKFGNAILSEEASKVIGDQISKMIKLESLKIELRNNSDAVDSTIKNIVKGIEYCSYLQNFFFEIGNKNKVLSEGVNCLLGSLQNKYYLNNLTIKLASGNRIESSSLDNFQEVSKSLSSLQSLNLEIKESNLKSQDIVVIKNSIQNLQALRELKIVFNRNHNPENPNEQEEDNEITKNFGELLGAMKSVEVLKFNYLQYQEMTKLNQNHILNGLCSGLPNLKVLHLMLSNYLAFNSESFKLLQTALSKCTHLIELDLKLLGRNQEQDETNIYSILSNCNSLLIFSYQIQFIFGQEMKRLKKNAMKKKKIVIINKS